MATIFPRQQPIPNQTIIRVRTVGQERLLDTEDSSHNLFFIKLPVPDGVFVAGGSISAYPSETLVLSNDVTHDSGHDYRLLTSDYSYSSISGGALFTLKKISKRSTAIHLKGVRSCSTVPLRVDAITVTVIQVVKGKKVTNIFKGMHSCVATHKPLGTMKVVAIH